MSMIGSLVAVEADQFAQMQEDADAVMKYLFSGTTFEERPDRLNLEKSWHGLHFLLTGTPWETPPPLGWAILGAEEVGEDTGYGPPRALTPAQVKEVDRALDGLSRDALAARFDPQAFEQAEIYSFSAEDAQDELEGLLGYYDEVRQFYKLAASEGKAVITYLT